MFMHGMCFHLVTVNVGRAGAASLDVIQEVDYVKQEAKVVYLLECLQKTPPPVGSFGFLATFSCPFLIMLLLPIFITGLDLLREENRS